MVVLLFTMRSLALRTLTRDVRDVRVGVVWVWLI